MPTMAFKRCEVCCLVLVFSSLSATTNDALTQSSHSAVSSQNNNAAKQNFDITGVPISHFPNLIVALAMVKKAACLANLELGFLPVKKAKAILQASDEVIAGKLHDQFVVDLIQGGAGTSTNMNMNEVLANRALEILGHRKGDYQNCHPNNDINQGQSTNDVYPTAAHLAICFSDDPLVEAVEQLIAALEDKGREFASVLKLGRTQLQDAVPMTLGQGKYMHTIFCLYMLWYNTSSLTKNTNIIISHFGLFSFSEFHGFAVTLKEDLDKLADVAHGFKEVNLGGTAIGTGINTDPRYAPLVIQKLAQVTGIDVSLAPNLVEASSDMGEFVLFSSMLKRISIKLSKIANDLRLLSSGPRGGFNDINLPAMQPGSSIMPGKVNPVIPEAVNQTCYQVIGNDLAVSLAAEAGQLQLNAMEPLIIYNTLSSLRMLTNACHMFREKCIVGITANESHCENMVRNSIGIITAFSPFIGYEKSTEIAGLALLHDRGVVELILEKGYMDQAGIDQVMKAENLTGPSSLISEQKVKRDRTETHMRQSSVDMSLQDIVKDPITKTHLRAVSIPIFALASMGMVPENGTATDGDNKF